MRLPTSCFVTCALMAAAVTAHAQAVPMGDACRTWLAHVPNVTFDGAPAAAAGDGPDSCRFAGVAVKTSSRTAIRADTLLVRGIDLDPAAAAGPPMTLRAEARGVRQVFHTGNAATDYLLMQQQAAASLSVTLDVTRDPTAGIWVLHELTLEGERLGRVSVDGEIDGLGPIRSIDVPPPGMQSASLRRAHAIIDSRFFVTSYVLPLIVSRLPQADTAAAVDDAVRAEERTLAESARPLLIAAGASPATIEAITAAIGDFPHPAHPLDVTVTAAPPLSFAEVEAAGHTPDPAAALARRVTVTATYAGPFGR